MDPSEGWTYITSICYPHQACVKITRILTRNGGGKLEAFHQLYSSLEATYHSWTLTLTCCSCQVLGHPHSITHHPRFWVIHFKPLIWSLTRRHDIWSYDVKCCQNPESCHPHVQEKSSCLYIVWSYVTILDYFHPFCFPFHVDDEELIMTFLRQITSCWLQLII